MQLRFDQLTYCREWILAALEYSDGGHNFDDIALGVLSGRYRLWMRDNGCAVTEILEYPRRRVCNVFLAGGDMQVVKDLQAPCEEYARSQGCTALYLTGRSGWQRALKNDGWEVAQTSMKRVL